MLIPAKVGGSNPDGQTYIGGISNIAHNAWYNKYVDEREPGCARRPAEILMSVVVHVCFVSPKLGREGD